MPKSILDMVRRIHVFLSVRGTVISGQCYGLVNDFKVKTTHKISFAFASSRLPT